MSKDIKKKATPVASPPEHINVEKAESNPVASQTRMLKNYEVGSPFMKEVGGWIRDSAKTELQYPRSIKTFAEMRNHAIVDIGATVGEVFLTKSLLKGRWVAGDSKSQRSKDAAAMLNWNFKNLEGGGWYESLTNIITCFQNGFSWLEKVYANNDSIEHNGTFKYKLKKLAPRAADSIQEWIWKDPVTKRDLIGLKQYSAQTMNNPFNVISLNASQPVQGNVLNKPIPLEKICLFSWNSVNGNPQGRSDFLGAYKTFKEITMVEAYEILGVSKSLAGVLVVRVPTDHLNKAAEDKDSEEARALAKFQQQCAAIQAGDQTFLILGSDTQGENGAGKYVYDMTLQGIEGGAGNDSTKEIIAEKTKTILNTFAAGFLVTGDSGVGSYSLADTKQSIHAFYMERKLMFIADVLQRQIAKPFLELNQYKLAEAEMPTFEYGELDDADADIASKVGQRLASGGLFPKDKAMLFQLWKQCGLDPTHMDDKSIEDIIEMLTPETSRAGESGGTSGTGGTQAGGSNSSLNMENAP